MRNEFLSLLLCAVSAPVFAADIDVSTTINSVTVYRRDAMISRRGVVSIPAGDHQLILSGLPADVKPEDIRLNIASPAVQMGALDFERITTNALISPEERALKNKQQGLQDQIAAIDDEIQTAQLQLRILENLAAQRSANGEPAVTGTNIPTALASAGTGSLAARAKIRDAQNRQRALRDNLNVVTADLGKITSSRRSTTQIRVIVRAAQPVATTALTVEYGADGANWNPTYAARLDSAGGKLALIEQAKVAQGTGENWDGVALTLSSGKPSDSMNAPDLPSLFVDIAQPAPPPPMPVSEPGRGERRQQFFDAPAPITTIGSEEIVVTGTRMEADVVADAYSVDYKIPGRVTVESDREPRLYPISEQSWDVKVRARALPRIERTAYVQALFKNTRDAPIRGGEMQVFRDGSYTGTARLKTVLPGDDATLSLGSDERIRVEVRDEEEKSGKRGLFGKKIEAETRLRFELTSFHDQPVEIDVVDRLPVPRNKEVEVETLKGATPPSETRFEGKDGVLVWRVTLQPRQTYIIRHAYVVRYPKGMLLNEEEGAE
jgi:uncharacterized protein (TIGR02231 family)